MKVEIEKKVKIELDSRDISLLIRISNYVINSHIGKGELLDFAKRLKQELER